MNNFESRIVFTNGVFDILHVGHIKLLEFCKQQGDYLVVGIDTDRRVKQIKGNDRPINHEQDRKILLEAIRYVDEVILFDTNEELQSIYKKLQPNVLVKGEEMTICDLRKKDNIPQDIEIVMYPYKNGYSTTNVMKKVMQLTSCDKIEKNTT